MLAWLKKEEHNERRRRNVTAHLWLAFSTVHYSHLCSLAKYVWVSLATRPYFGTIMRLVAAGQKG